MFEDAFRARWVGKISVGTEKSKKKKHRFDFPTRKKGREKASKKKGKHNPHVIKSGEKRPWAPGALAHE